jgi:hypothetical protein
VGKHLKDVAWKDEGTGKTYSNGPDLLVSGIRKLDERSAAPWGKPAYLDGNPTSKRKPTGGCFCAWKSAVKGTHSCDS